MNGAVVKPKSHRNLSALQQRMHKQLQSAQFRMLNESMYSTTGEESSRMMRDNPHLFSIYHSGYSQQVKRWPKNPLDDIITFLSSQKSSLRIADMGCGEARLARQVPQQNVKSFDLVAANADVIACDIAHVPLPDSSIDVVVFCLSLMGTNYGDFLSEARRILVPNGLVLVVEVASRFDQHDSESFVTGVKALGFRNDVHHPFVKSGKTQAKKSARSRRGKKKRDTHKAAPSQVENKVDTAAFFLRFAFTSTKSKTTQTTGTVDKSKLPKLAACVYKKR